MGISRMTNPPDTSQAFADLLALLPPESQQAMRQLMASSKERPSLESVSKEELDRLDAEDREAAVIGWVGRHLHSSTDALAAFAALPRGLQVYYLSFVVEAEVMNGGFNQFFWNASVQFAPFVEQVLMELGCPRAAGIFREAWAVAIEEGAGRPDDGEWSLSDFSASYEETRLDQFDAPFCELATHFPALRRKIVDTNEPAFYG